MADVVFRLHLPHILSFLGLTTELSGIATTCKLWARIVSELFKKRDVILDCFSTDVKYFDFRLQTWTDIDVAPDLTTKNPLALLLIDEMVTVIDTCELNIKQFHPARNSWVQISKPTYPEQEHPPLLNQFACAHHDGHIYLVGGHHTIDDSPSSAVWSYSIKSQTWMECVALPSPFFVCSCAVLFDFGNRPCLTVIGSNVRDSSLTNEGFYLSISEISSGKWHSTAPAPHSIIRLSSRSIVWSRHSVIIGMWMRPHKFTLIEFNLFKNSWGDPYPLPSNYYIFPATINSQIVALAVDLANRLVTLRYDREQWHYRIHSQETLNKFSLIIGVPYTSVTDR